MTQYIELYSLLMKIKMIDFMYLLSQIIAQKIPFLPDEEETLYRKEARVSTINPCDAMFWSHW